jgi:hypothetical protein
MAQIDLHKFERDLLNRPAPGSNAPPVSIRAKDLDGNYKKVTLLASDEDPPAYGVRYTPDGTILTDIKNLPDGAAAGDLLYWNGSRWLILPAPASTALRVLTIQNGTLAWTETEACA